MWNAPMKERVEEGEAAGECHVAGRPPAGRGSEAGATPAGHMAITGKSCGAIPGSCLSVKSSPTSVKIFQAMTPAMTP